jgi:hypothetical protein
MIDSITPFFLIDIGPPPSLPTTCTWYDEAFEYIIFEEMFWGKLCNFRPCKTAKKKRIQFFCSKSFNSCEWYISFHFIWSTIAGTLVMVASIQPDSSFQWVMFFVVSARYRRKWIIFIDIFSTSLISLAKELHPLSGSYKLLRLNCPKMSNL